MELWLWIVSGLLWSGSATFIGLGIDRFKKGRRLLNTQAIRIRADINIKTSIRLLRDALKSLEEKSITRETADNLDGAAKYFEEKAKTLNDQVPTKSWTGEMEAVEGIEANKKIVMAAMYFGISAFLIGLSSAVIAVFKGG